MYNSALSTEQTSKLNISTSEYRTALRGSRPRRRLDVHGVGAGDGHDAGAARQAAALRAVLQRRLPRQNRGAPQLLQLEVGLGR